MKIYTVYVFDKESQLVPPPELQGRFFGFYEQVPHLLLSTQLKGTESFHNTKASIHI